MHYSGLIDGLTKLYCHEGFRGLYKGFIPGLWGTSHGAIQFMLYEEFKKTYSNYRSVPIDTKLVNGLIYNDYVRLDALYLQGPFLYVSMAASSKLLAVCLTYPYQVVRARLQVQNGISRSSDVDQFNIVLGSRPQV